MGLIRRVSDVVSAQVHELIDCLEKPECMVRHTLREIDDSLATMTAFVARSIAAERMLARQHTRYLECANEWRSRALLALNSGDEALARRAVAQQVHHEQLAAALAPQLEDAIDANEKLRRQLSELRGKQSAAQARASVAVVKHRAAAAQQPCGVRTRPAHSLPRLLRRFDQYCDRLESLEHEAAIANELESVGARDLQAQCEQLETSRAIESALANLRANQANPRTP